MKSKTEIKMIYNVEDDRFYIYLGEDYLYDTSYIATAFQYMENKCRELKEKYYKTKLGGLK